MPERPAPNTAGRGGSTASQPGLFPIQRADPPQPPAPSPTALKAQAEQEAYLRQREAGERRSVIRGLILLALLALVFSLIRAGLHRAFFTGWWRRW